MRQISNCCGEGIIAETDICSACGEHCKPLEERSIDELHAKMEAQLDEAKSLILGIKGIIDQICKEYKGD